MASDEPHPGEVRVNAKDGLRYIWIPPGSIKPDCTDLGRSCDSTVATSFEKGFWFGETSVTQEAYARVVGANPSHDKGEKLRVTNVNWSRAQSYCRSVGLQLPSPEQWSYVFYVDEKLMEKSSNSKSNPTYSDIISRAQPGYLGLENLRLSAEWTSHKYKDCSTHKVMIPASTTYGQMRGQTKTTPAHEGYQTWCFTQVKVVNGSDLYPNDANSKELGKYYDAISFRCAGNLR
jgi:hypothetical protein